MFIRALVTVRCVRCLGLEVYEVTVSGAVVAVYPSRDGAEQYCRRLRETIDRQLVVYTYSDGGGLYGAK